MSAYTRLGVAMLSGLLLTAGALPAAAADRDGDGLRDAFEKKWGVTDPGVRDSDHDGVLDSAEDDDGDRLGNLGEQRFGTNPGRRDSDGDGLADGREDHDRDGRSNASEQDQRRLPTGLRPSIAGGRWDFPPIRFRCQSVNGSASVTTCKFGPAKASTRIVLLGDSHAMVYSSPVRRVAESKGWRLTTMTKTACAPLLGIHTPRQAEIDGGRTCRAWRRNVIAKLTRNPPDLIIVAHSDRYKLLTLSGRPLAKGSFPLAWKKALKKTLAALPARSRVLVMGDVPENRQDPRKCLDHNRSDMSACVSPREPASKRPIEKALREAARQREATFRTLYGKICSYDPCPVVQGKILMWRDTGHLTDTYVTKLTPSIRDMIEDAIAGGDR